MDFWYILAGSFQIPSGKGIERQIRRQRHVVKTKPKQKALQFKPVCIWRERSRALGERQGALVWRRGGLLSAGGTRVGPCEVRIQTIVCRGGWES